MNANDLTFGIEIECLLPVGNAIPIGGYHCGTQIAELPLGWNAQRDSSIATRTGFYGVEVVSPILKGPDGIAQVKKVCEWLHAQGAAVNQSTGLHVHVGFKTNDAVLVAKIIGVVANFEKAIYASTGTKSRERSQWCQSVQNSASHQNGQLDYVTRYHVINVKTNRPTVEFRAFAGTLNFVKISAHIGTCLGLVAKTLKVSRKPSWVAKKPTESSPIARGGEGLTDLNRLFYWLGWTKGREQYTFGTLEGMPDLKTLKKQLVKLAKKYDAAV